MPGAPNRAKVRGHPPKAQSEIGLVAVIRETARLWRKRGLDYDQTKYVVEHVRRDLALEAPRERRRSVDRLDRFEVERLIQAAYRTRSRHGLMIKTLFLTGTRVSEFLQVRVEDLHLDSDPPQIHIVHAKGGASRCVPILPNPERRTNVAAMSDLLNVAFQHNAWATKELITYCRRLTLAQLSSATQGTCHSHLPGHHQPQSLLDTLDHLVLADADYLPRPRMQRPMWALEQRHASDLDQLEARANETAQLWQVYLDDPLEATDLLLLDQGTYEVQSSIPIVQALHHGTLHRAQVCAILTGLGIKPPDLQVWTYGEATGRGRELSPQVTES